MVDLEYATRDCPSGQPRAVESADIIASHLKLPSSKLVSNSNWREREFGLWEGKVFESVKDQVDSCQDPPEGENLFQLEKRLASAIYALPAKNALIVSHGGLWHVMHGLYAASTVAMIENADVHELIFSTHTSPALKSSKFI